MEFHVRKVRETETGGMQTAHDEPLRFEMSIDQTSFYAQLGGRLYNGILDSQKNNEVVFDFMDL